MKNIPITGAVVQKLPKGFHVTAIAPSRAQKVAMAREIRLSKRTAWMYIQRIVSFEWDKENHDYKRVIKKVLHADPIKKSYRV